MSSIRKHNLIFPATLIILCFFLILLPSGIKEKIAGISIRVFYLPINNIQGKFEEIYGIRERARQLETELVKAKLKLSYYADAVEETKRLREFLNFSESYEAELIPAEIIKRPDLPHRMSVLINVGENSGVKTDMAVIAPEGLAGRIQRVYENSSEVQLLIDPSSRISAVDTRSRVHGILKFLPSEGLMLDNVPGHEFIALGDTIKSSGMGGIYPPGIPIGVISNIEVLSSSYLFASVSVEPFTNFNKIERLFIVRKDIK